MSNSNWKPLVRRALDLLVYFWLKFWLKKTNGLSVVYAGKTHPKSTLAGGAVKLKYLSRRFPDGGHRGNFLYLVSSALPKGALGWASVAKDKGLRFVLNQNGVAYPAWAGKEEMKLNARARALLEKADFIIYQSEFCRLSCEKWVGKATALSSVVYNPVDTTVFQRISETGRRPVEFLLMGSCSQPGRIKLPLEALSLAKQRGKAWRMRVAGRFLWENAEADFRKWVAELGLEDRVQREGQYAQAEAAEIYSSAKVLMHMQDKDASPTVPLEAMACGLPVLGIASGGMPELMPPSLGTLLAVEQGWDYFYYPSAENIFTASDRLLAQSEDLSSNCRKHVEEKFSLSLFVEKHEKIFSSLH